MERKVIDGRVGPLGQYDHLIGENIKMFNDEKSVFVKVIDVYHYDSLEEYIEASGCKTIAPQCNSLSDAMGEYLKIYTTDSNFAFSHDRIKENGGVNGLLIKKL